MPNPFFFAGKITNPDLFVGREKELKRIFGYLDTTYTGQIQHVSIVGDRRIGKSSLLYYIRQNSEKFLSQHDKFCFAYLDLDSPHCHTLTGLLRYILGLLELPSPKKTTLEQFYERIENFHTKKGVWPVLLMDEFEHLPERNTEFKDPFFESLRSLGNNNIIGIITASQKPLEELAQQGDLTSPFFNIFHRINLEGFTDIETQILLNRGRQSDQPFTEYECKKIINIAGNHPARLQILGSKLYEAKDNNEVINWKDIEREALEEPPFVEHAKIWKSREKWILQTILWPVWDMPHYMGHTFMVFIGRGQHTNEIADRITGYLLILAFLGLLAGIIPWPMFTKTLHQFSDWFIK